VGDAGVPRTLRRPEIDGGIQRREALRWAKEHQSQSYVVAAMFNDAFDDEECKANPFRNRRNPEPRGRGTSRR
jgi:hypothetical protein